MGWSLGRGAIDGCGALHFDIAFVGPAREVGRNRPTGRRKADFEKVRVAMLKGKSKVLGESSPRKGGG